MLNLKKITFEYEGVIKKNQSYSPGFLWRLISPTTLKKKYASCLLSNYNISFVKSFTYHLSGVHRLCRISILSTSASRFMTIRSSSYGIRIVNII